MNRRHITAAVATASLAGSVLSAAALSNPASAHVRPVPVVHHSSLTRGGSDGRGVGGDARPMSPCYTQPVDGTGNAVISQVFSGPNAPYTNAGADDFTTAGCTIRSITVPGQYSNPSIDTTANVRVTFYSNAGTQPGAVLFTRVVYSYYVIDTAGTFQLALINPVTLGAGTYWISVQAVGVTPASDYWYWDTANLSGYPAMWENPGGGFGGVCLTWDTLLNCGAGANYDFAFSLDTSPLTVPCYTQLTATGSPVNSQRLPGASPLTDLAADDFTVTHDCKVYSVDVIGRYFASGAATQFQVRFYPDAPGSPGLPIIATRNVTAYTISGGDFHLPFSSSVGLPPGHYWVSVQAWMPGANRWRWYSTALHGYKAVWENIPNGWGTSCTAWTPMLACPGVPGGPTQPDLAFSVNATP